MTWMNFQIYSEGKYRETITNESASRAHEYAQTLYGPTAVAIKIGTVTYYGR